MATFHPFSRLPFEIRTIIWQMTVEPRQVELRINRPPGIFRTLSAMSTTPVPAVMQVCHEARNLGLYQREFTFGDEPRYLWVNLEIDLISIGKTSFRQLGDDRRIIRRIKCQRENSTNFFNSALREIKEFTNLNEMHIVCEDGLLAWQDAWEYLPWPCPRDNVRFIDIESGEMVDGYTLDKRCDEILAQEEEQV
ncbi:uncharacterized protein NECHADRAFT_37386 [Fusarium vanettenii 77-13-4]|uniref:2EXR domain-containing protein n=1 Tax=Fusarium vanettenii (strain ATCC MYA-4622 / CBS 123669 / FGSC 9596 / NRRL 45880 / 77-13-4) TaxID=660122 RepID=C7ZLW5_FUSV7|nr:uncharacterized protein NECHADRAFT_37386 [Fusarium vanettenii 77-13-4]EEU34968.1 hypothetical protein NECHADRAFT_37386 [Fusarium vanettenii 77-13-4]